MEDMLYQINEQTKKEEDGHPGNRAKKKAKGSSHAASLKHGWRPEGSRGLPAGENETDKINRCVGLGCREWDVENNI